MVVLGVFVFSLFTYQFLLGKAAHSSSSDGIHIRRYGCVSIPFR